MASRKAKRKKFFRTVSGKVRVGQQVKKTKKKPCEICGRTLHGVPHGKSKAKLSRMSKTEKKPSVRFGGRLCSTCRRRVIDSAIMVSQNSKRINSVELDIKGKVEQALERMK